LNLGGTALLAVVLAFGALISVKNLITTAKFKTWRKRFTQVFVLLGLSYILLRVIPGTNGVPLNAIRVFQPDLWLCLTVGGWSAVSWALSGHYTLMYVWYL